MRSAVVATDRADFDRLLAEIDVQDWLDAEGVGYRKSSSGQLNLTECPFCGDRRGRAYMRCDDGRGKCFAGDCQKGWNLYSFARQHYGGDNRTTRMRLEAYAKGAGHVVRAPEPAPAPVTPAGWSLPSSVALPTPEGHTLDYLTKRRVLPETQALFGLRYCHAGEFPYEDMESRARVMDFSGRVILPVADLDGVVHTFQGRDITGESDRRYLFPPRLPGTGRFLYGGHLARGKPHLVICEGPFDVIAAHQATQGMPGFLDTGVVGSFGLSIGHGDDAGDDQLGRLRILRREGLKSVTFLWDGEKGALAQALEAGQMLKREGLAVRIGLLPEGLDPAEVPTQVVRDAIAEALPLSDLNYLQLKLAPPYP